MAMVNGSGRGCSGGSSFRLSFAGLHAVGIVAIVALLCWVCFFNGIDSLYPLDKTEALQLALADSMATGGDWVTPAIDGLPYFDKPPLPYWIGALMLRLAPHRLWLPRVGAALGGCVGVMGTVLLVRFGSGDKSSLRKDARAVMTAIMLASSPGYFLFARVGLHDIYLTASITTALAVVFLLSRASRVMPRLQIVAGFVIGLSLGIGVLAKGLLSLALTVAIAALYLMVAGPAARRPFTWRFGMALLLSLLLVAAPWHLAAWQAQGGIFLENYFIRTHVNRFATELDSHAGPWFFYVLAYPVLTLPWVLPAAAALIEADCLNLRRWRRRVQSDPLLLFCTIWIGVTVVLLSLSSTKLPHYILPSVPPTAIAAAYFFWPVGPRSVRSRRLGQMLLAATVVVLLIGALLLAWLPALLIPVSRNTPGFSMALRGQLASSSVVAGVVLLACAGGWAAWRVRQPQLSLAGLWAGCILCFLLFQAPALQRAYHQQVQRPRLLMAERALAVATANEPIQVVEKSWYSIKLHTHGRAEILNRGKAFGEASDEAVGRACARTGLLLGPSSSVEKTAASCGAGSFTLLYQDTDARLSLGRWQPATPLS
jgi:4-amino-4-deoxy-L-arabinose transferase-like glycosyltransferase